MLEEVRKACLPAIWSQGVKLAREGSVSTQRAAGSEAIFRVRAAGHVVAPTVTLYFADAEWSCDCGGKVDPCAHVAAATIACGGELPAATNDEAPPPELQIAYRLAVKDGRLTLARFVGTVQVRGSLVGKFREL